MVRPMCRVKSRYFLRIQVEDRSGVLAELARMGSSTPALTMGIPDEFVPQGKADLLLHDLGLDAQGIAAAIEERL